MRRQTPIVILRWLRFACCSIRPALGGGKYVLFLQEAFTIDLLASANTIYRQCAELGAHERCDDQKLWQGLPPIVFSCASNSKSGVLKDDSSVPLTSLLHLDVTLQVLKPFLDSGQLDMAIFDAVNDTTIRLSRSGVLLGPGTCVNPICVVANYLFDTLCHDIFQVHGFVFVYVVFNEVANPRRCSLLDR